MNIHRLSLILKHANTQVPPDAREDFYKLKQAILERYGRRDGDDIQEIVQACWGIQYEGCGEHCQKCGGTGIYYRTLVHLERWRLGDQVFHRPARRLLFTNWPVTIQGKIRHRPKKLAFACWRVLTMIFSPSFHLYLDQFRMNEKQLRRVKAVLAYLLEFPRSKWQAEQIRFDDVQIASKRAKELIPF